MSTRRGVVAMIGVLVLLGAGAPAMAADLKLGATLSLTGGTDESESL